MTTPPTAEDAPPPQRALDAALVERFLAAYADLKRLVAQLERRSGRRRPADADEGPAGLLESFARDQRARGEIETLLRRHGFANLDDWSLVVYSVMLAYGFADPEQGLDQLEANVRRAIEDVRADATLDERQKAEAIAEMEAEYRAIARMQPLPGNVEVVRPFMARIRSATEGR